MKKNRVVITGLGVVSPIGSGKEKFWNALINKESGVGPLTHFDPSAFTCKIAAQVKDFDSKQYFSSKEIRRLDTFVRFAVVASQMAVEDANLDLEKINKERAGVYLGSGIGGLKVMEDQYAIYLEKGPSRLSPFLIPMFIVNIAPGEVGIRLGFKGPNSCAVTACATGTHCMGDAFRMIQRGEVDVMVAGGTEAATTPLGFGGFCSARSLAVKYNDNPKIASRPFDKERDGFIMGEGAGIVVIESLEHALARNANIYAEIVGYGMTGDAYHVTAPVPGGDGSARCMKAAIADAGIEPNAIDYINAHGTSTKLNDKTETSAIKTAFGDHAYKVAISSTKSLTGHMLGAAGSAEAIATCLMMKEKTIIPTVNYEHKDPECDLDYVPNELRNMDINYALSNSLGFGGHNASIILKKFENDV